MRSVKPSSHNTQNAIFTIRKRMLMQPRAFASRIGVSTVLLRKIESGKSHATLAVLEEVVSLALQFGLHGTEELRFVEDHYKARIRFEILTCAVIQNARDEDITASTLMAGTGCYELRRLRCEPCIPSGLTSKSIWNSGLQRIEFIKRLLELRDRGYLSFADIHFRENIAPDYVVGIITLTNEGLSATLRRSCSNPLLAGDFNQSLKQFNRRVDEKLAPFGLCCLGANQVA